MCVLPRLATEAVKICQAATTVHAAMALKAMDKAVWMSMNVQATSAVCTRTVRTPWAHTAALATLVS